MALAVRPPHEHSHLRPLTYDEVRQFPDDGYRYELVDGELLVTPSPNKAHQRAVTRLTGLLLRAVPDHIETLVGPIDWSAEGGHTGAGSGTRRAMRATDR